MNFLVCFFKKINFSSGLKFPSSSLIDSIAACGEHENLKSQMSGCEKCSFSAGVLPLGRALHYQQSVKLAALKIASGSVMCPWLLLNLLVDLSSPGAMFHLDSQMLRPEGTIVIIQSDPLHNTSHRMLLIQFLFEVEYIFKGKKHSVLFNISRRICHDLRQVILKHCLSPGLKVNAFWHELARFQHSALGFCCVLLDQRHLYFVLPVNRSWLNFPLSDYADSSASVQL